MLILRTCMQWGLSPWWYEVWDFFLSLQSLSRLPMMHITFWFNVYSITKRVLFLYYPCEGNFWVRRKVLFCFFFNYISSTQVGGLQHKKIILMDPLLPNLDIGISFPLLFPWPPDAWERWLSTQVPVSGVFIFIRQSYPGPVAICVSMHRNLLLINW